MNDTPLRDQLDSLDSAAREDALAALVQAAEPPAKPQPAVNLHAHTFFSFNGYGYSPAGFAWRAKEAGLLAAGIVDFDVLDGVEEFLRAGRRLGLRTCAGIETRVFVPELADAVINSPGEPGIAYHMGVGFTRSTAHDAEFLARLAETAAARTRAIAERVNAVLDPVTVDFENDVTPLTPAGNATERHLCVAYEEKARQQYPDEGDRAAFWVEKLGVKPGDLPEEGPPFQALIRSKLMKQGGPGYMAPDSDAFPRLSEVNGFVRGEGAVPTLAWLDGTSPGESGIERLFSIHEKAGTEFVNVIPDRNWNIADPDVKREKVQHLFAFAEAARDRHMPLIVGTEMNAHGQRFVDDFSAETMKVLLPQILEGAYIAYGHTRLEQAAGLGYGSEWARERLGGRPQRNVFYEAVGKALDPGAGFQLDRPEHADPDAILRAIAP